MGFAYGNLGGTAVYSSLVEFFYRGFFVLLIYKLKVKENDDEREIGADQG